MQLPGKEDLASSLILAAFPINTTNMYVNKMADRLIVEFFFFWWGGTYVTRYCGHFWPIVQPQMIDEGDCGAIGGMKIGRGNRRTCSTLGSIIPGDTKVTQHIQL
jgi:hypothetical protein